MISAGSVVGRKDVTEIGDGRSLASQLKAVSDEDHMQSFSNQISSEM